VCCGCYHRDATIDGICVDVTALHGDHGKGCTQCRNITNLALFLQRLKQYQIPLCPSTAYSAVPGPHAHTWSSIYNRDLVVRAVDKKLHVQPAPLIIKSISDTKYLLIG
jgi:hypothetical protein